MNIKTLIAKIYKNSWYPSIRKLANKQLKEQPKQ